MKEADIRPENLVAENLRLYYEDIMAMMIGREGFVEVPCPVGCVNAPIPEFVKDGFEHVRCATCDTLYISPRPTFDMLMDYYRTARSIKHWNDVIFPATEEARRRDIFNPRAQDILNICYNYKLKNNELLVDVGAGFGTFCLEINRSRRHFKRVVAVEPSPELAESCRSKGLEVLEGAIEAVDLEAASVITAFELVEHLFCPRKFIEDCHRALVKDGLLILTTPNIKGFDLAMLGEKSTNVGGPNHLQFFHPESLVHLLEALGFEVIKWGTPGKLDAEIVLKQIVQEGFDAGPFLGSMLKEVGPREAFQRFLVESRCSSHMMMVARKV